MRSKFNKQLNIIRKEKKIAGLKRKINKGKPHTMGGVHFDSIVLLDLWVLGDFDYKLIN